MKNKHRKNPVVFGIPHRGQSKAIASIYAQIAKLTPSPILDYWSQHLPIHDAFLDAAEYLSRVQKNDYFSSDEKKQLNLIQAHENMLAREEKLDALLTQRVPKESSNHWYISNVLGNTLGNFQLYESNGFIPYTQLELCFEKPRTIKQQNIAWYQHCQKRRKKGRSTFK